MSQVKFEYGVCETCGEKTWLKWGSCAICNDHKPQPEVVDDIMGFLKGFKP